MAAGLVSAVAREKCRELCVWPKSGDADAHRLQILECAPDVENALDACISQITDYKTVSYGHTASSLIDVLWTYRR